MSDSAAVATLSLPDELPAGERVLLQARPTWRAFAIHVFHARKIAIYCLALLVWRVGAVVVAGKGIAAALIDGAWAAPIAVAGALLPVALAWAYARASTYTITDRRLIMQIGVALPMTFNLPYRRIESAGLRLYRDGSGDIAIEIKQDARLAYAHLWPHVRPWRLNRPEPMLRVVPQAEEVARVLSAAMRAAQEEPASAPAVGLAPDRARAPTLTTAVA